MLKKLLPCFIKPCSISNLLKLLLFDVIDLTQAEEEEARQAAERERKKKEKEERKKKRKQLLGDDYVSSDEEEEGEVEERKEGEGEEVKEEVQKPKGPSSILAAFYDCKATHDRKFWISMVRS